MSRMEDIKYTYIIAFESYTFNDMLTVLDLYNLCLVCRELYLCFRWKMNKFHASIIDLPVVNTLNHGLNLISEKEYKYMDVVNVMKIASKSYIHIRIYNNEISQDEFKYCSKMKNFIMNRKKTKHPIYEKFKTYNGESYEITSEFILSRFEIFCKSIDNIIINFLTPTEIRIILETLYKLTFDQKFKFYTQESFNAKYHLLKINDLTIGLIGEVSRNDIICDIPNIIADLKDLKEKTSRYS